MSDNTLDFEAAMSRLEILVSQMESGELTLEQSVAVFEEGVMLSKQAQAALQAAEQKVKILMESNGELTAEPFVIESPSDAQ
ncbi:MAG: exodeoxyribonuclease VII small subunit [Halieaceae bacterium]|jgi:exodeoxyribonuclease VII small subunit|nr:exodeoxyribonuclease VII small subunit [Halieaceae bacterium]